MALDPSIILGVKPPEIANPGAIAQQALQTQNLRTEGQVHEAQVREMQAQEQDRQLQSAARAKTLAGQDALAASIKKNSTVDPQTGAHEIDYQAVANEVGAAGFPTEASAWIDMQGKNQENLQKLTTAHRAYLSAQFETLGGLASTAKTRDDFTGGVALAAAHGLIDEDTARRVLGQVDGSDDPNAWQAVANHYKQLSPSYQKSQTPEGQATLQKSTADAAKAQAEADNLKKFGRTTPVAPQSKDMMVDGKPSVVNFDPNTAKYTLPGTGEDVSARVKPMPPAAIQAQNAGIPDVKLSTREEGIANDLAYGGLTFNQFKSLYPSRSGAGAAIKEAIYGKARELNPTFNPAEFETGFKLYGNPQIRQRLVAIDALGPVIDQIDTLAQQSGNTDLPAFNKLLQAGKYQIGNTTITNFRQLQTLLGDEVGNALGVGTGSDLKTKLGLDLVNPTLSPANFAATMAQLRNVLNARKQTLLQTMGPYGQPGGTGGTPPAEKPPDLIWDPNTKAFKPGGAK